MDSPAFPCLRVGFPGGKFFPSESDFFRSLTDLSDLILRKVVN